jgi:alkylation response protein AidB-like acyl-CoA dehydrogenase
MQFRDDPDEAAWRAEVRAVIRRNAAPSLLNGEWFVEHEPVQDPAELLPRPGGRVTTPRESLELAHWRRSLAGRGWVAAAWPKEFGGAGLGVTEQFILAEELALARAPVFTGLGLSVVGPTLLRGGTAEQKARHLPAILSGDVVWCQGFSEPNSGSDLASVQLKAVRDGDEYVLNGAKTWTTDAQAASWMFLLARTDPTAPKHRGISYFLLDMKTPGLTVHPIAAMNNTAPFNECVFENVRVPVRNILGELNRGWYVATTSLDFERTMIADSVTKVRAVDEMMDYVRDHGCAPALRHELVARRIEAAVGQLLSYRIASMQKSGLVPNQEASMAKLFHSELYQRLAQTRMRMIGMKGNLYDRASPYAPLRAGYPRAYQWTLVMTIAGGTSEVQRNVIATRGLGLPR